MWIRMYRDGLRDRIISEKAIYDIQLNDRKMVRTRRHFYSKGYSNSILVTVEPAYVFVFLGLYRHRSTKYTIRTKSDMACRWSQLPPTP